MFNKLTPEEYNVLNLLSHRSKLDCWFVLEQDEDGNDYVLDNESGNRLGLAGGISLFNDGLTSLDDYDLTDEDKDTYIKLIKKVNEYFRKRLKPQRLKTLLYNAIVLLESDYGIDSILGTDLEEELGITQEEYDEIIQGDNYEEK